MNDNLTQIIWIDDDTFAMKKVVNYLFAQLWDKNIKSYIYILKDDDEMVRDLNTTIYDQFIYFLIDKGYIYNGDKCQMCDNLVISSEQNRDISGADITKKAGKNIFSDAATKKEELAKYILKAINSNSTWFDTEQNSTFDQKNTWYGIDLCLQKEDFNILRDYSKNMASQQNEKLLSMHLYDKLITNNKVFLYSTYDIPNDIIKAWMELYISFSKDGKKTCVYNRKGKLAYCNSDEPEDLLELINGGIKK